MQTDTSSKTYTLVAQKTFSNHKKDTFLISLGFLAGMTLIKMFPQAETFLPMCFKKF